MPRRSLAKSLSGEEPSLDEVWNWYEFQDALIRDEQVRVLEALRIGAAPAHPRYFGRSRDELIGFFDAQRAELGNAAMLGLLAAAEAALRVDYVNRVIAKKKDAVSRNFAALYKQNMSCESAWRNKSSMPGNDTSRRRRRSSGTSTVP